MTIAERIIKQKHSGNKKVSRIWICPNIVKEPKVGKTYTYSGSIETKPPKHVDEYECSQHWIEENTLCMIYRCDNPIIFT